MSEPVAFYRGDWKGDIVFRKNNTVDVRKNKSDFTKGLIKPLYADNPNQPQLTIPKSIADALDVGDLMFLAWTHGNDLLGKLSDEERNAECRRRNAIAKAYLAGKALGVDLVKVVEG